MEIALNLDKLKKENLLPDEAVLLYLLYHKDFKKIIELFGKLYALELKKLISTKTSFILDNSDRVMDTILSNKQVEKLFGFRSDNINFWEFYNCYPVKVGTRILRSSGPSTQLALKHEKKYLSRVKTVEEHQLAIAAITAFVSAKKLSGDLKYLQNMETVLNNSMWEQWVVLIESSGNEGRLWNDQVI